MKDSPLKAFLIGFVDIYAGAHKGAEGHDSECRNEFDQGETVAEAGRWVGEKVGIWESEFYSVFDSNGHGVL